MRAFLAWLIISLLILNPLFSQAATVLRSSSRLAPAAQVPQLVSLSLAAPAFQRDLPIASVMPREEYNQLKAFLERSEEAGLLPVKDSASNDASRAAAELGRFTPGQVLSATMKVIAGVPLGPGSGKSPQDLKRLTQEIWVRLLNESRGLPETNYASAVSEAPRNGSLSSSKGEYADRTSETNMEDEPVEEDHRKGRLPTNMGEDIPNHGGETLALWEYRGKTPHFFGNLLLAHMDNFGLDFNALVERVPQSASLAPTDARQAKSIDSYSAADKIGLIAGASADEEGKGVGFAPGENLTEALAGIFDLQGKALDYFRKLAKGARAIFPAMDIPGRLLTETTGKTLPSAPQSGSDMEAMQKARREFYEYLKEATHGEMTSPQELHARNQDLSLLLLMGLRRPGPRRNLRKIEDPLPEMWNSLHLSESERQNFYDIAGKFFEAADKPPRRAEKGWRPYFALGQDIKQNSSTVLRRLMVFRNRVLEEEAERLREEEALTQEDAYERAERIVDAEWIGVRASPTRHRPTLFASGKAVQRMIQEDILTRKTHIPRGWLSMSNLERRFLVSEKELVDILASIRLILIEERTRLAISREDLKEEVDIAGARERAREEVEQEIVNVGPDHESADFAVSPQLADRMEREGVLVARKSLGGPATGWENATNLKDDHGGMKGEISRGLKELRKALNEGFLKVLLAQDRTIGRSMAQARCAEFVDKEFVGMRILEGRGGVYVSPGAIEELESKRILRPRSGEGRSIRPGNPHYKAAMEAVAQALIEKTEVKFLAELPGKGQASESPEGTNLRVWEEFRKKMKLSPEELGRFIALPPNQRLLFFVKKKDGDIKAFAARLGLSYRNVWELITSPDRMRQMHPSMRGKIAGALGIRVQDLFASVNRTRNRQLLAELDAKGVLSPGARVRALREENGLFKDELREGLNRRRIPSYFHYFTRIEADPQAVRKSAWITKRALAAEFDVPVEELIPLLPADSDQMLGNDSDPRVNLARAMKYQGMGNDELAYRTDAGLSQIKRYLGEPEAIRRAASVRQARLAKAVGLTLKQLMPSQKGIR